ncbi:MAG: phenylalanine--tRNA ligase beta subunit-related protein [Candidatus Paceibacterota bacterium]|jgi:DNA/RNA-binding domain of Phe-tRNA-synthetase-like protein
MKLIIQKEILDNFDQPIIGVVKVCGTDNHGEAEEISRLLRDVEKQTRIDFQKLESHGHHPNLIAWRKAYKKFGSDPHQYRCSAESLVRRVLKGESVPHINKLVDIYNYISVKYVVPVGGEDTDTLVGNLQLALASGTEFFVRLNGTENDPPVPGEVVYKDDEGVICRRWNWREAERTKLTEETKNAIIAIDALFPLDRTMVESATNELASLIKRFCGGEIETEIYS